MGRKGAAVEIASGEWSLPDGMAAPKKHSHKGLGERYGGSTVALRQAPITTWKPMWLKAVTFRVYVRTLQCILLRPVRPVDTLF